MCMLYLRREADDSDVDDPINFQVSTHTAVTVGPTADWLLRADSVTDKLDGQRTHERTNARKNIALAYPHHGNSCSKFGRISPSGLGGD